MNNRISRWAYELLKLPQFRGKDEAYFDTLEAAAEQRRIFFSKPGLRLVYSQYCRPFVESAARAPSNPVMVELGAGPGILQESIPGIISTDVMAAPWLDAVCSAYSLPFATGSLDRIFLMFVCHHLGKITYFLDEANRCLKSGGEMVIVDAAITSFSRIYYRYLHVDEMDLEGDSWEFDQQGRLSDANVALPWMVFIRDQEDFLQRYPEFIISKIEYNTCLSYFLSGGARLRQLVPTICLKGLMGLENWVINKVSRQLAVSMALTIRKLD